MKIIGVWLSALFLVGAAFAESYFDKENLAKLIGSDEVLVATLSPDGEKVLFLEWNQGFPLVRLWNVHTKENRVLVKTKYIKSFYLYWREPRAVHWVNDQIFAVDFNDQESESFDLTGGKLASLGEAFARRVSPTDPQSSKVLAFRDLEDGTINLVDAATGDKTRYRLGLDGRAINWAFDGQGRLRAVTMLDTQFWSEKTTVRNWYRASDESPWILLDTFKLTDDYWLPIAIGANDRLIIKSRNGGDAWAVYTYDVEAKRHMELMAKHESQDILFIGGLSDEVFQRIDTAGLKPKTYWFDERWAKMQASVDQVLPNTSNLLSGNIDKRLLVYAYSDVDRGRWYLLDVKQMALSEIAEVSSIRKPEDMLPVEEYRYPSYDGLMIPAYLTKPKQAGPAPLLVMIHGGPHVRDYWGWDMEVQIFAQHGYAVFQPQFRGSSGFGLAFEKAGYGQWGLAMQDDISAGVEKLIRDGVVDPNRVCIYGASYGGYAALWGTVKTPHLYRCAISYAGVTDLALMFKDGSDTNDSAATMELMRNRVGDPTLASQDLDKVSPLRNVEKINVPLLIGHGVMDKRVPIKHSRRLVSRLRELGKPHQVMEFEDESHGLIYLRNRFEFYRAALKLLSDNIGSPTAHKGTSRSNPP